MGFDPKGKIARTCDPIIGKIRKAIDKKCVGIAGAFPGCGTDDSAELAMCLDAAVECRVCLALNQADGLRIDCDGFDDGLVNGSCP